jgi:hypothetical protein
MAFLRPALSDVLFKYSASLMLAYVGIHGAGASAQMQDGPRNRRRKA